MIWEKPSCIQPVDKPVCPNEHAQSMQRENWSSEPQTNPLLLHDDLPLWYMKSITAGTSVRTRHETFMEMYGGDVTVMETALQVEMKKVSQHFQRIWAKL